MSSYVEIANAAAIRVGASARLTAPDENTVLGRAVAAAWDLERKAALRDGSWNFATERARLPALATAPVHGADTQFQLPADSLKLLKVEGSQRFHYRTEGRRILADTTGPLDILYLRDVTEPADFDASFAHSFALRIACAIGNRIAGSAFDKGACWQEYRASLASAQLADTTEDPAREHEESEWNLARQEGTVDATLGGWVDGG